MEDKFRVGGRSFHVSNKQDLDHDNDVSKVKNMNDFGIHFLKNTKTMPRGLTLISNRLISLFYNSLLFRDIRKKRIST